MVDEAPQKRTTRPTWLLWLLLAIVIAILLISGGLAFVLLRSPESPTLNATSLPLNHNHPVVPPHTPTSATSTTTGVSTSTEGKTTTTAGKETTTHPTTSTSTTTSEMTTTPSTTTGVATMAPTTEASKELLSSCSIIPSARVSCARTPSDVTPIERNAFSPMLYKLNFSVVEPLPKRNVDLRGALQLFFSMNKGGKQISLHAAQNLRGLEEVAVVNCETGKTICVSKSVSEGDNLFLILDEEVSAGSILRLDFPNFAPALSKDVTYTKTYIRKMGQKMMKQLMVGSKLKNTGARGLFPSFDSKENTARLSLCVKHWPKSEVRSNSPVEFTSPEQTCFRLSHPLTADQLGFSTIEGAELLLNNATTLNGQHVPAIELFIDATQKNKTEKHLSIQDHAANVIAQLSSWLGYPYPQDKLTLVYAPLSTDYLSSLGLITLPDPAFEYSYHNRYHESLTRALVSQWTDGILSTDECFQVALTHYLEWKLDEKLGYLERNPKKEINLIRPGDLSVDSTRATRFIRTLVSQECTSRDVAIFFTLDETYGQNSVTNMVKEILRTKAFSYASISDFSQAASFVMGSPLAGKMLEEWFARKNYPVMKAQIRSQQVDIQQITSNPWKMVMEVAGSKGKYLVEVNELKQPVPFVSDDYVVIDPDRKSTAFVVYDADGYSRLKRCWDSRTCPANQEALKSIFRDFGAVLRSNSLEPMEEKDKAKWKDFLQFSRPHMEIEARCCVSHILRQAAPEPDCHWQVDECKKLRFGQI